MVLVAASAVFAVRASSAVTPIAATAQSALAVGVPTMVDPIRGAGEPYIAIGRNSDSWITGPGGSSAQTSFFWHSVDGNLTFRHVSPNSSGHLLCRNGGGDSQILIDRETKVSDTIWLTDQEALANFATGRISGGTLTSSCESSPAITADRPFQGLLHPTSGAIAPQYTGNGNKPMAFLSWLCTACGALAPGGPGGLAFAWSDDGLAYHPAEPGVPDTGPLNLLSGTILGEGGTITTFNGHGTTFVDQHSGYVFTGLSCAGSCPNGSSLNELGVVIGKPPAVIGTNKGEFGSLTYQKAADKFANGTPFPQQNSLFPVISMDPAGTIYLVWTEGSGTANPATPLTPTNWHVYYVYSKDLPDHKVWSKPIQVDTGPATTVSNMAWVASGDPGKLAFTWLGTDKREHPSKANDAKVWHPFLAVTTNGDTPNPTFQQAEIGMNPNHLSDMCLAGTVGCITAVGNRNMADFISVDIAPNGAAQVTWASDANKLATLPTTLIPGLPINMTAVQISGPKLVGTGDVSDSRYSTTPVSGTGDFLGDATDPRAAGPNIPQLDLTGTTVATDGANILLNIPVASLASLSSPDALHSHVWWLTTWQWNTKVYFAKVESDSGGTPTFTAGIPASYDRPALNAQTAATLVDYRGGAAVTGQKIGNEWIIKVPPGLVGNPTTGSILEGLTSWTVLDNGNPPGVTAGIVDLPVINNIPTIFDATPAFNTRLGVLPPPPGSGPTTTSSNPMPNTAAGVVLPVGAILVFVALVLGLGAFAGRRRGRGATRPPALKTS